MKNGSLNVLCIDDDEMHVEMLRRASAKDGRPLEIFSQPCGDDALEFLRGGARRPDFILLDCNMPGKDGLSVLQDIKTDPTLRTIPVLMLSGVSEPAKIHRAYENGANLYFVKTLTLESYAALVSLILTLWGTAELPSGGTPEPANVVE